jgi:hypothetical protein
VAAGGIADSPYWCHCPGGDLIGVGGGSGGLYLLNPNLSVAATSAAFAIRTTPGVDAAGDWFFAADDGFLHEVQRQGGTLTEVAKFALHGERTGSAPQLGACSTGICIYLGTQSRNVYLVPLDARAVVVTACIGASPSCSPGMNPRLWSRVEVGSLNQQQTVRVTGWSYYSP